jgi:hypothetical protein
MAKGKNARTMATAAKGLVRAAAAAVLGLALEIHGNLVEDTPVDTGHARNNWVPSQGVPVAYEADAAVDPLLTFATAPPDAPLYITNNVPYIVSLDEGHSPQAPAGFVKAAIERAIKKRGHGRLIE